MATQLDYPNIPFHALLSRAAENQPDKIALIFRDQHISYSDLDRQANRIAHGLIAAGVQRGDRVALFLPNCPQYEAVFFGAMRAGGVPTPLNPSYREREVRHQVSDAGARILVVHASLVDIARASVPDGMELVIVGAVADAVMTLESLEAGRPDTPPDLPWDADDVAALPYSSGTTGLSKGVMLTNRNLVSNACQFVDTTRTTNQDVLLIFLPMYHIYGVALMATAMAAGAAQVLMERFDLGEVLRLIDAEQVTELYVVPPVMLALVNAPGLSPDQFHNLRFIMSAAAPLSPESARRVADRLHVRVIQAYGMTETSPLTHMVHPDWPDTGYESVGRVAPDTECRIVDLVDGETPLTSGEIGEVAIQGPQVMKGYWNAPDETSAILRDGWLRTGDVGKEDPQGNLYILDRKKEMIKYKAFSIAPAELESVLLEHADVIDCGVTSRPDDEAGEIPVAYVVLRPGATTSPDQIKGFLRGKVATYKQIHHMEMVDSIPRTPSGKILRRVLKEQATDNL